MVATRKKINRIDVCAFERCHKGSRIKVGSNVFNCLTGMEIQMNLAIGKAKGLG